MKASLLPGGGFSTMTSPIIAKVICKGDMNSALLSFWLYTDLRRGAQHGVEDVVQNQGHLRALNLGEDLTHNYLH